MSIFNNLFGGSEEKKTSENSSLEWIPLTNEEQLEEIVELSMQKPVLLFKHSTRCSISRMALKQLEREYNFGDKIQLYFLDLLEYRSVSNAIATRFNVVHQSPQAILIKNGKSVYDASHSAIEAEDLKGFL